MDHHRGPWISLFVMNIEQALPEGFEHSIDGTHAVFTKPIEVSESDDRNYRLIRLKNKMEVLLIHDPNTDKSAAAVNVHVGTSSEPDNIHGTTKYPRENEYLEYITLHSGQRNASTGNDNTDYYFEVGHAYLEGTLDRLAQFFISPAFHETYLERELRAVDSEYKRYLKSDVWRLYQLEKSLSSRQNPYWRFQVGNIETLKEIPTQEGIDIRDETIKFYHKYYSSNIMKLVILGRDELVSLAIEKFSDVNNLDIPIPSFPNPPLTSKELQIMIYAKPITNTRSLLITFPFPSQPSHYALGPGKFISRLIGHEGSGSLISLLKRKGWVNGVLAYSSVAVVGYENFYIKFTLTKEGQAHLEDIIVAAFQYIEMLRHEGTKAHNWDEEKQAAASYVRELGRRMFLGYTPETILSGANLVRGNDPGVIMSYINELRIDNWRGQVVSQDPMVVPGGSFTITEKWFGTGYHVDQVSASLMERLQNLALHPEFNLPPPNEFLPKSFEIFKTTKLATSTHPALIKDTPLIRLWYKKDNVFLIPKVNIFFRLYSPLATASPTNHVQSVLCLELIEDSLNEELYSAKVAGLSYSLTSSMDGIILKVGGYNIKANVLLRKVISAMKALEVGAEQSSRVRDCLERQYQDSNVRGQDEDAKHYMGYLNTERQWLDQLHIEGLIHGNMDRVQAMQAGDIVQDGLAPRTIFPSEHIARRSVLLPEGYKGVYERQVPDPTNVNSAIEYYIQTENHQTTDRKTDLALTGILVQIIKGPSFTQLRTNEQLGYRVTSHHRKFSDTTGISFIIQSERNPVYLEHRIEEFLRERIADILETMTESEFKKQVKSVTLKRLEKDRNLVQETARHWKQIISCCYDFNQIIEEVEEMENITLEQMRRFFHERIMPDSPRTKKLSVHIHSQKLVAEDLKLKEGTVIVRDAIEFKAGMELNKAPCPVVNLAHFVEP
ncbi:Insulinase (Peptidase M16) [Mortierella sp. AD094]|nr:Insulinase (Peptidase M16) [Mortierella sp. AD094]